MKASAPAVNSLFAAKASLMWSRCATVWTVNGEREVSLACMLGFRPAMSAFQRLASGSSFERRIADAKCVLVSVITAEGLFFGKLICDQVLLRLLLEPSPTPLSRDQRKSISLIGNIAELRTSRYPQTVWVVRLDREPLAREVRLWPQAADQALRLDVRSLGVKRTRCAQSEFFRV